MRVSSSFLLTWGCSPDGHALFDNMSGPRLGTPVALYTHFVGLYIVQQFYRKHLGDLPVNQIPFTSRGGAPPVVISVHRCSRCGSQVQAQVIWLSPAR